MITFELNHPEAAGMCLCRGDVVFQSPVREGRGTVEGASGVREWVWGGCGKAPRQRGCF